MKARIFFGVKPPKDWQVYSALQKSPEFQKTYIAWDRETNPEVREMYRLKLEEIEAKTRKEMNLPGGE